MQADRISRVLTAVLRARVLVLILYAATVPFAIWEATRIPSNGAIDELIVPSDPDFVATRAFQKIFPEQQLLLLVFEAPDPWSPDTLGRLERAKTALSVIPHVGTFSVLEALRRARPNATAAELKQLATGTEFFRKQGLVGPDFITLLTTLDVTNPHDRDAALDAIDAALEAAHLAPRKVGSPYVSAWIEHQAATGSAKAFPIFGVLLVGIALFLFRSVRALLAIVLALGAAVALAVAAGGWLGLTFTIVSALVPLTVLVTTLATLVYLHERFVDHPEGMPMAEHHVAALRNKFLPVTASTLAAVMGFAALAVSKIQPVRELGIWTALGLVIAWLVAFTLFPALQRVLRAPTGRATEAKHHIYARLAERLPRFTYRFRWWLVGGALAACAIGVAVLVGIPGVIAGAQVEVDPVSNIDSSTNVYRDLVWFRAHVTDLNVAHVWIHLPKASATDADVLHAIDDVQTALEALPDVTAASGPTTMLRLRSYLAGHGTVLPRDPDGIEQTYSDVEQLLLTEPAVRAFIDANGLVDLQLQVLFKHGDAGGYAALAAKVGEVWKAAVAASPALAGATARVVGESALQAKVGANLVPTLAQSFALTAGLIFVVFLALFRSGIERLLAMIPSLFALLVAFLGMRVLGGSLNVATIIIATTVLGTTENDQIHFFHHMHERTGEPLEVRLRHALHVSGRAIVFATFINAAGFLGLAVSSFPPIRQFGLMTAGSFVLALLADFTALPAALWIASRERPSAVARTRTDT